MTTDLLDAATAVGGATHYYYADEAGADRYRMTVNRNPNGGKVPFFEVLTPAGWRGFKGCMDGVDWVLYRLPEVLEAVAADEVVWLVEGEKCADSIVATGATATTSPGGAKHWAGRHEAGYVKPLVGAIVHIIIDEDPAGREHGVQEYRSLINVAKVVRIFRPAASKHDVADHLAAGLTLADLYEITFDRLVELCPVKPAPRIVMPATRSRFTGKPSRTPERDAAYGRAALRSILVKLAGAEVGGGRNIALNEASFACGRLIPGGYLAADDAITELLNVARELGLSDREASSTIESGMAAGLKSPRRAA
jgi:hypothetical protein